MELFIADRLVEPAVVAAGLGEQLLQCSIGQGTVVELLGHEVLVRERSGGADFNYLRHIMFQQAFDAVL